MRRRLKVNSLSSSLAAFRFGSGLGAVPPRPPAAAGLGEKGAKASIGGSLTGGDSIQPTRLRNVVESAP